MRKLPDYNWEIKVIWPLGAILRISLKVCVNCYDDYFHCVGQVKRASDILPLASIITLLLDIFFKWLRHYFVYGVSVWPDVKVTRLQIHKIYP